MRFLLTFTAIQAVATIGLFLGFMNLKSQIIENDERIITAVSESNTIVTNTKTALDKMQANEQNFAPASLKPTTDDAHTVELMRAVIRMELANAQSRTAAPVPSTQSQEIMPTGEREKQRILVNNTINAHIASGSIDAGDMSNLQSEMAKLSVDDRQKILSRITKAMNAGTLKGAL